MPKLPKPGSLKRRPSAPPPESSPDLPADQRDPSSDAAFLSFGDAAELKILESAAGSVAAIYNHPKPDDAEIAGLAEKDITKLSMQQVGQVMQYFTGMHAYVTQQVARADLEYTAAKRRKDHLHAALMLQNNSDEPKYITEAKIADNPELKKASNETFRLGAYLAMLKSMNEGLSAKADLASREVTRRAAEREFQSRGTTR